MSDGAKAGFCSFCAVFAVGVFLFAMSFARITPLEMGIAINQNIMVLDHTKTYTSGRRLVGIGKDFVRFPITYQTIQINSAACRSSDGMPIFIDVSIAYQIKTSPEDLTRLYRDTGGAISYESSDIGWEGLYYRMAEHAIRDVTARYSAFDFFTLRSEIAQDMMDACNERMQRMYASVEMFELVNMEFNEQFANAIEVTQVALQDVLQANAERDVAVIDAESDLVVVTKEAQVKVAAARAEAAAVINAAEAEAATLLVQTAAQIASYKALAAQLNFTTPAQLLAYQFTTALQNAGPEHMLLQLPYPAKLSNMLQNQAAGL